VREREGGDSPEEINSGMLRDKEDTKKSRGGGLVITPKEIRTDSDAVT